MDSPDFILITPFWNVFYFKKHIFFFNQRFNIIDYCLHDAIIFNVVAKSWRSLSLITFLYTLAIVHFYIRMSISIYDKFYSNFITLYGYITSYYSCAHYLWLFLLFRPSCRLTIAMEAIHCSRDFLGDHQFHCFIVSTFFY